MISLSKIQVDPRLINHSDFVGRIIATMNLTDTQIDQLNHPTLKLIQAQAIDDVSDFLKSATQLMICGDYDADGVCSTAIAYLIGQSLGIEKLGFYIPNRFTQGYGVSLDTIKQAYEKGYTDLLIVDTGVKAHEAVNYALSLNMNVAIVDHHLIEGKPPSCPLLHPDYLDDYAKAMCASGLMFLVAEHLGLVSAKITAYAALATIADIMPLWGKNREIVKRGVDVLSQGKILNIDVLWKRYGMSPYEAKILAFQVVPKINAVGRMADRVNMNTMVHYLLSDNEIEIQNYAKSVLSINQQRKLVTQDSYEKAKNLLSDQMLHIVSDKTFHEGILGIVANQIVSETGRPSLVLKEMDQVFKGSARSSTISLQSLFSQLDPNYFSGFGGHDFAFGVTIKKEAFEDFVHDVQKLVPSLPSVDIKKSIIYCDMPITPDMMSDLKSLDPFGQGFEMPVFAIDGFTIKSVQALGSYGYKLIFDDFWLKDAVIFNKNLSVDTLMKIQKIEGVMDVHPRFGLSFSIDNFSV